MTNLYSYPLTCNSLPLWRAALKREELNSTRIAVKIARRTGFSLSAAKALAELNGLGPKGGAL